jgi:hypothetical protein
VKLRDPLTPEKTRATSPGALGVRPLRGWAFAGGEFLDGRPWPRSRPDPRDDFSTEVGGTRSIVEEGVRSSDFIIGGGWAARDKDRTLTQIQRGNLSRWCPARGSAYLPNDGGGRSVTPCGYGLLVLPDGLDGKESPARGPEAFFGPCAADSGEIRAGASVSEHGALSATVRRHAFFEPRGSP